MIWLVLVAVVFVGGGAWFVAKSMRTRVLVAAAGVAAVAGYWFIGKPDMHDDPLSGRLDVLEAQYKTAPDSITPQQRLAMLEGEGRKSLNDPRPHKEIGDLYAANGNATEAMMAYRAALQRDPSYAPAMDAISELNFVISGEVDEATRARLPEIQQKVRTAPESLTSVQYMVLLEERLKSEPNDPMAHRMMGEIYESAGHVDKAETAFKATLKETPNDRETLKALADMRFKATNNVDPETADLYHKAYNLDRSDLRLGYMAGVGDWLQGKKDDAKVLWKAVESSPTMDEPHRQMFAAMRQMFKIDAPAEETPPKPDGKKPPQKGK